MPPQTLPANFTGWDAAPATLPKDFDKWDEQASPAPGLSLDRLANEPNNAPINTVKGATEHGLASIGQGVFQAGNALLHPIDTAKGMYQTAKDVALSAIYPNGPIQQKLAKATPLDIADFAGNQAGQIIAGLGTEKIITPVTQGLKTVARRAPLLGKTPEGAYESALKPSTTIPEAKRAAMVQTGLQEGIPVSKSGVKILGDKLEALQNAVAQKIQEGAGRNVTVDPHRVAARLADTADKFSTQVNPEADVNAVANAGNEFLRNNPNPIPADRAQALKQGTYQQLGSKAYGELGSATMEAQKALARGIKEELASQIPEISALNAAESKLYDLQPVLERAVNRIANHQLVGIGTPITAGAVKAVTGSNKLGAVAGLMKAVLDDPMVKSRIAIAISKTRNIPLSAASGRIAAYQTALSEAAQQQVQSQP